MMAHLRERIIETAGMSPRELLLEAIRRSGEIADQAGFSDDQKEEVMLRGQKVLSAFDQTEARRDRR